MSISPFVVVPIKHVFYSGASDTRLLRLGDTVSYFGGALSSLAGVRRGMEH